MSSVQAALDPVLLLTDMLGVPSPTGSTAAAAAHLVAITSAAGFRTHVDTAGNVVMCWGDGAATSDVLLLGHLDTVPGDIPVRTEAGRLHGRGTVDAKGPLAAALAAVACLPPHGPPVTVVAVRDEEGPSLGARQLRNRVAPSALVVLEPSGWDTVSTAYRGCVRLSATISLPCAHHAAAQPSAGDVLVTRLADLQHRLDSRGGATPRGPRRAVDAVQLRINGLRTAERDGIESAGAAVEVRIPAGVDADTVVAVAAEALGDAVIEVESACEAVHVSRSSRVPRQLARAICGAGGRPRYTSKTGTCDLNVVLPEWRCSAAVYGPGDCSLDHTPHESIAIDDLRRGAAVLSAAVRALR